MADESEFPGNEPRALALAESCLDTLWQEIAFVMDEPAARTVFQNALDDSASSHTFLSDVVIDASGPDLSTLKAAGTVLSSQEIIDGFRAFVDHVATLVYTLTGTALASRLDPVIARFKADTHCG